MKVLNYRIGMMIIFTTLTLASLLPVNVARSHSHKKPTRSLKKSSWKERFQKEVDELEKQYPQKFGIFVKDLNTGEEFSFHGDEKWYLASTVKVPIAMEVLRQVDAKKLSLEDKIEITLDDYVDGNGPLKFMKPGSLVSIRYLIEQMIIWSDNMASDMLIRVVGLDQVNNLIQSISPQGIASVTTLKDVRRHIFGELHSKAFELSGQDFLELRKLDKSSEKLQRFADLLKLDLNQLNLRSIDDAYNAYYQKGLNSGSPRNYSKILEALWEGKVLSKTSRDFLIHTMMKTETGKQRIKSGLNAPWIFAHKTGTQFQRIADVGFISNPKKSYRKPIIVVSFVRDISEPQQSAKVLSKIAKIISKSGVL